jgi:Protein of unknown function (DUF3311)
MGPNGLLMPAISKRSLPPRCIAADNMSSQRGISIPKSVMANCRPRSGPTWEVVMWLLLLVPFVGLLWVPFYNFAEPALFGFPFFYWYQLVWVPITSVLIFLVYRSQPHDEAP